MTEWDIHEIAAQARQVGYCAKIGPAPAPGLPSYLCTLSADHAGVHLARDTRDDFVYDSWV